MFSGAMYGHTLLHVYRYYMYLLVLKFICTVKSLSHLECPEGKVFMQCGTACPLTCSNQHDVTVCTLQCVAGKPYVYS